jgi:ATP adenylyltransferase
MTQTDFVDIDNARNTEQAGVMEEILSEGHCPFCAENLRLYHKQPILKQGKYWVVTPNQWPYDHTKTHLLAIHTEHIESLEELSSAASSELFQLLGEIIKEGAIPGGGVAMRFGDTQYSAGTVKHLHAQFVVPDVTAPDFEPVRIKIGKKTS